MAPIETDTPVSFYINGAGPKGVDYPYRWTTSIDNVITGGQGMEHLLIVVPKRVSVALT